MATKTKKKPDKKVVKTPLKATAEKTAPPAPLTWATTHDGKGYTSAVQGGAYTIDRVPDATPAKYNANHFDGGMGKTTKLVEAGTLKQCKSAADTHAAKHPAPTVKGVVETAKVAEDPFAAFDATVAESTTTKKKTVYRLEGLALNTVFSVPDSGIVGQLLDKNACEAKVRIHKPGAGVVVERWAPGAEVLLGGDKTLLNGHIGTEVTTKSRPSSDRVTVDVKNTTKVTVECTAGSKGGKRYTVMGKPVTHVLRWMGYEGWSMEEAKGAIAALGLDVQPPTFSAQIASGRYSKKNNGEAGSHGDVPELTTDQQKALNGIKPKVAAK